MVPVQRARRRPGDLMVIRFASPGCPPAVRAGLREVDNLREIVINQDECHIWTDPGGAPAVIHVLREAGVNDPVVILPSQIPSQVPAELLAPAPRTALLANS